MIKHFAIEDSDRKFLECMYKTDRYAEMALVIGKLAFSKDEVWLSLDCSLRDNWCLTIYKIFPNTFKLEGYNKLTYETEILGVKYF